MTVELPKYPSAFGPSNVRRLEVQRAKYRERAESLREELNAIDAQWAATFDQADRHQSARDRVSALAKSRR
jgi:hypothetical protein